MTVAPPYTREEFFSVVAALESRSTHPVAKAIVAVAGDIKCLPEVEQVEEIAGLGIRGSVAGKVVMAGSCKLMQKYGIAYDAAVENIVDTVGWVSIDGLYAGCITIADEIKEDAADTIRRLHHQGIRQIVMLSGDSASITLKVAHTIGMDAAFGNLLPEGKVSRLEALKADPSHVIAFVGDGINDAPVLAVSDVGIAMGGMGSDAAIEIADVILQTDQLSGIAVAIRIAKATKRVVMQNIVLAVGFKVVVLLLGAIGIASLWVAVFADVGVALLAILNAVRILRLKF
jgi:Cd2+/Zn2+-exporting ATPase